MLHTFLHTMSYSSIVMPTLLLKHKLIKSIYKNSTHYHNKTDGLSSQIYETFDDFNFKIYLLRDINTFPDSSNLNCKRLPCQVNQD